MARKVLAIGLDPAFADPAGLSQFTPEMVRSFIDAQLDRTREAGYDVVSCLVDRGETAEAAVTRAHQSDRFDCAVIGAGLRLPPEHLLLFERIINLVPRLAPDARIVFNRNPTDTLAAVQRCCEP